MKITKRAAFIWLTAFFCLGTAIGSVVARPGFIFIGLLVVAVIAFIFISKQQRFFAFLPFVCALGCFYPFIYESFVSRLNLPQNNNFYVEGRISSYPLDHSRFTRLDLVLVDGGKINLMVDSYEDLRYGNIIRTNCNRSSSSATLQQGRRDTFFCRNVEILDKSCSGVMCIFFAARERISENLQRNLSPSASALALGILLGDRSGFTPEFRKNLRASGTTHIVALSGFNITIIVSFLAVLFFFIPIKWRPFSTTLGILIFVALVGPSASVVRAAIMGSLVLFARNSGRLIDIKGPISFAALAMVLHNPFIIVYDAGFLLSFSALIGIIFLAPWLCKVLFGTDKVGTLKLISIQCFSAGLAVAPVAMILFDSFNWLSFIPNIMIIWSVPLAMFFSFASGIVAVVSDYLALPFSIIAESLLFYAIGIINFFARGF